MGQSLGKTIPKARFTVQGDVTAEISSAEAKIAISHGLERFIKNHLIDLADFTTRNA